jgi:cell division inhibitor SepF
MSNFMKNAKNWLGLGADPYYDDEYGDPDDTYLDEPLEEEEPERPVRAVPSPPRPRRTGGGMGNVTSVGSARGPEWEEGDGGVRVIAAPGPVAVPDAEPRGVVRPLPSAAKPHVVSPSTFNDVQEVADCFKSSQPVIVNLQGVDRDLSRRLIDFASGLCYGLEGNMERVADQVFLLTPSGAQVSDDDRRRLREHGLVDER